MYALPAGTMYDGPLESAASASCSIVEDRRFLLFGMGSAYALL
jgi:hypothetical protein